MDREKGRTGDPQRKKPAAPIWDSRFPAEKPYFMPRS